MQQTNIRCRLFWHNEVYSFYIQVWPYNKSQAFFVNNSGTMRADATYAWSVKITNCRQAVLCQDINKQDRSCLKESTQQGRMVKRGMPLNSLHTTVVSVSLNRWRLKNGCVCVCVATTIRQENNIGYCNSNEYCWRMNKFIDDTSHPQFEDN